MEPMAQVHFQRVGHDADTLSFVSGIEPNAADQCWLMSLDKPSKSGNFGKHWLVVLSYVSLLVVRRRATMLY